MLSFSFLRKALSMTSEVLHEINFYKWPMSPSLKGNFRGMEVEELRSGDIHHMAM